MKLTERHYAEEQFHNAKAGENKKDFYALGAIEIADRYWFHLCLTSLPEQKLSWDEVRKSEFEFTGSLSGKVVLDLGCGNGYNAIKFAKMGALVYAVDISANMVKSTDKLAKKYGLSDVLMVRQMSAEKLEFPSGMFDLVAGHSILHHTDLSLTRNEVRRVLKPGGKAVFLEPLGHNLFINLFRMITPWRRTKAERPLRYKDIEIFAEPFARANYQVFYLFALAAFALLPLQKKKLFQFAINRLNHLDSLIIRKFPALGRLAWIIVIELFV